ncbi:helix-turn-helix domain-containing protein [Thermoflavimicrobium daqui]|uniref:HTH cro/C1-type domain-containing protein n=1 Tax=Thermoflavimicrobium daqui TaxID=2137476 RepID=A0A364K608_9BACL|nr:helix-turn-helix domain-containing protein [Thermoflavimicrobium daqui]RAL25708.1 hypothetical protein DL897_06430 [Thermoflavimicrobium daqui]
MKKIRVDRVGFGNFVRKTRKSKGLRQEDLVDDNISQSAVSYIETGNGEVSVEKMEYILKKLDVKKKLSDFVEAGKEDDEVAIKEELKIRLAAIENIIDLVSPEEGLVQIRDLSIPLKHEYNVFVEYLKGKCFFFKRNWNKAHKHFFGCIHMLDHQHAKMTYTNLKSACYHELSTIEYIQNNFHQALSYSKKAMEYFQVDGQRKYYKDIIMVSQVIYLEKTNQVGEALNVLDDLTFDKEDIVFEKGEKGIYKSESKEAALNMYEMKSKLLAKHGSLAEAKKVALKGIELARIDKMYDRSLELWTTLGSIYIEQNKLNLAECCFRTALKLKDKVKKEYLLAYVYNQLGKLYYKFEDFRQSQKEYLESIKYSRKANDVYLETQALIGLGECYIKQNKQNKDKILACLNKALELAKQHNFSKLKNKLFLTLGNYMQEIGDPNFASYAMDFFYSYSESFKGGENEMTVVINRFDGDPPNG